MPGPHEVRLAMQGTLEKLSHWIGRWNPRYLVLEEVSDGQSSIRLLYYESKEQSVCGANMYPMFPPTPAPTHYTTQRSGFEGERL